MSVCLSVCLVKHKHCVLRGEYCQYSLRTTIISTVGHGLLLYSLDWTNKGIALKFIYLKVNLFLANLLCNYFSCI